MNKSNEKIESRLNEIILICRFSKRLFCKKIGIKETNYNRFISNNSMKYNKMEKLEELGINTKWIFFGEGERFNYRKSGIELRNKLKHLIGNEKYEKYYKLTFWLNTHYNSIDNFDKLFNVNVKNYLDNKHEDDTLPYQIEKILSAEGLNTKWLYHLDELPYLTSKSGREKRSWVLNNCNEEHFLYNEIYKKNISI